MEYGLTLKKIGITRLIMEIQTVVQRYNIWTCTISLYWVQRLIFHLPPLEKGVDSEESEGFKDGERNRH